MSGPTRVGDLIRIIGELDPDQHELAVIADLLPLRAPAPPATATTRPSSRPAANTPAPVAARPPAPPAPVRVRPDRTDPPAFGATSPLRTRRPEMVLAAAIIGSLILAATDHLAWPLALAAAGGLALAGPLGRIGTRRWSAWRHSVQRRAAVTRREGAVSGGGGGDPVDLDLTESSWQLPPPSAPLGRAGQLRAVATLLAGRHAPGEIDLRAMIRMVAARRALAEVPRRLRWRAGRGMHLHVDVGPGLDPYRSDVDRLRRELRKVAAAHAVTELRFHGDPRTITGPRRGPGRRAPVPLHDRLPPPGTPVLVVTDLGIAVPRAGSPPEPAVFVDHHRLLTGAGCPVRYLVPYPASRWPPEARGLPVLSWSDELGTRDVLASAAQEHRGR